jgi:hypothetical protein
MLVVPQPPWSWLMMMALVAWAVVWMGLAGDAVRRPTAAGPEKGGEGGRCS